MGKAKNLFFSDREDALHNRVTPTQEQRDFLQVQWNALAAHLKQNLFTKYGYRVSTWLQGSYKYGTLIRPINKNEEYDVDVGVYFEWKKDGKAKPAPEQLREWVQQELVLYTAQHRQIKSIDFPPKARCSRAVYTQQFHIDTPVYHLDATSDSRRLALLDGGWEPSDPKRFYKWFRDVVKGAERDQLRRIIRYLKGWAAIAFASAEMSRPSSILLTVLATDAYRAEYAWRFSIADDDEILAKVIRRIHDKLVDDPKVVNPAEKGRENLNRIPAEYWDGFMNRLQALRDSADAADDAADEVSAALAWAESFSFLMPLPNVQEVEVFANEGGRVLMRVPEIDIRVYQGRLKEVVAQHVNEVDSVAKGCKLVFTITNPHDIPEFATIEWTLRNVGQESDNIGDLGHRRSGTRMLTMEETTTYDGLHYMDCAIRVSGNIYAVRRVPVHVKGIGYSSANLPQSFYKKIKIIRERHRYAKL
jgi:hypothetical protein